MESLMADPFSTQSNIEKLDRMMDIIKREWVPAPPPPHPPPPPPTQPPNLHSMSRGSYGQFGFGDSPPRLPGIWPWENIPLHKPPWWVTPSNTPQHHYQYPCGFYCTPNVCTNASFGSARSYGSVGSCGQWGNHGTVGNYGQVGYYGSNQSYNQFGRSFGQFGGNVMDNRNASLYAYPSYPNSQYQTEITLKLSVQQLPQTSSKQSDLVDSSASDVTSSATEISNECRPLAGRMETLQVMGDISANEKMVLPTHHIVSSVDNKAFDAVPLENNYDIPTVVLKQLVENNGGDVQISSYTHQFLGSQAKETTSRMLVGDDTNCEEEFYANKSERKEETLIEPNTKSHDALKYIKKTENGVLKGRVQNSTLILIGSDLCPIIKLILKEVKVAKWQGVHKRGVKEFKYKYKNAHGKIAKRRLLTAFTKEKHLNLLP